MKAPAATARPLPPGPVPRLSRLPRLDALRGLAMVWMAAFHFSYDLVYFGYTRQNFYTDPFWTVQRVGIVSLFLLCAGAGQAIAGAGRAIAGAGRAIDGGGAADAATAFGLRARFDTRFRRRWAQIAGCACLVSLGSWLMFPHSYISFGVLHFMAVALLLVQAAALPGRRFGALVAVAVACGLAPWFIGHPWFDSRWTNWIGLVTTKPIAEDYVPLLPWLGVVCVGLAGGGWLLRHRPRWLAGPLPPALQPLAALGRWSLSFYMLHQPILIGLLTAAAWLHKR